MVRVTKPGGRIGIAELMCLPTPMPAELVELDIQCHGNRLGFRDYFRTVDWNADLFRRAGLAVTESFYFPESRQWWLEYRAAGKVSASEQALILADGGRWLSLGLVVGEKPG